MSFDASTGENASSTGIQEKDSRNRITEVEHRWTARDRTVIAKKGADLKLGRGHGKSLK